MKYLITSLFFLVSIVQAEQFQAPITDTQWLVTESPLKCSMHQDITRFGGAEFSQIPGGEFNLTFTTALYPSQKTDIYFEIAQAPWQNSEDRLMLVAIPVEKNQQTFTITGKIAKQAFTYIKEGMFPTIRYQSQNSMEEISVLLSTVHFRDSHIAFTQCVEQLTPYTFEQMQKLTVYFNSEESVLHSEAKQALTRLADYVKIDDSIRRITVSGHTDNHGRKRLNIPLSAARSLAVKVFLINECDLDEAMITTSFHREFVATTSNKTGSGRTQNRRAEIELIR
ncbi:MAG: OmpA family protein [Methylophaga sp.]|nr:OmpA family protein [Methylophaga sp.]